MNENDIQIANMVKNKLEYLSKQTKELKQIKKCKINYEFNQNNSKSIMKLNIFEQILNQIKCKNKNKLKSLNNLKNNIQAKENIESKKIIFYKDKFKKLTKSLDIIKIKNEHENIMNSQYFIKFQNLKIDLIILKKRNNKLNKKVNYMNNLYENNQNIFKETFQINKEYNYKIDKISNNLVKNNKKNNEKNFDLMNNYNNLKNNNKLQTDQIINIYIKYKKSKEFLIILKNKLSNLNSKLFNLFSRIYLQNNILNLIVQLYKIGKIYLELNKEEEINKLIIKLENNINIKNKLLNNSDYKEENFILIKNNILNYLKNLNKIYNWLFIENNLEFKIIEYYKKLNYQINDKNNKAINLEKELTKNKKWFNLLESDKKMKIFNYEKHRNFLKINNITSTNYNLNDIKILNLQKLENLNLKKNKILNEFGNEKYIISWLYFINNFFKKIFLIIKNLKEILKNNLISNYLDNEFFLNLNYLCNNYIELINENSNDKDNIQFNYLKSYLIKGDVNSFKILYLNPIIKFFFNQIDLNLNKNTKYDIIYLNNLLIEKCYKFILGLIKKYLTIFYDIYLSINNNKTFKLKFNQKPVNKKYTFKNSISKKSIGNNIMEEISKSFYQKSIIKNINSIKKKSIINNQITEKFKNLNGLENLMNNFIDKIKNSKNNKKTSIKDFNSSSEDNESNDYYNKNFNLISMNKMKKNNLSKKKFNIKVKEYKNISKKLNLINNDVKQKLSIFNNKYYIKQNFNQKKRNLKSISKTKSKNEFLIKSARKKIFSFKN